MPSATKTSRGLCLSEAAAIVGVHRSTLYRWIIDGEGPRAFVKQGPKRSTIRIQRTDLNAWMRENSFGGA